MRKVIANKVHCLACGKTIESKYRHDYQECGCPNRAMVDGGLEEYTRYGAVDMSLIKQETIYEEDQRQEEGSMGSGETSDT